MADSYVPDGIYGLATSSFNAEYQTGRSREADSLISIRPLPFGGGAVVQSGGFSPRRWVFSLFFSNATDLARLEAARGYHGTLNVFEGSVACTLEKSTGGTEWYPDGSQSAIASFLLDN